MLFGNQATSNLGPCAFLNSKDACPNELPKYRRASSPFMSDDFSSFDGTGDMKLIRKRVVDDVDIRVDEKLSVRPVGKGNARAAAAFRAFGDCGKQWRQHWCIGPLHSGYDFLETDVGGTESSPAEFLGLGGNCNGRTQGLSFLISRTRADEESGQVTLILMAGMLSVPPTLVTRMPQGARMPARPSEVEHLGSAQTSQRWRARKDFPLVWPRYAGLLNVWLTPGRQLPTEYIYLLLCAAGQTGRRGFDVLASPQAQ